MKEQLKIISLEVENFKRIKAIRITTDGKNLIPIAGRNDQGKSSVIDSIAWILGGNKNNPPETVRKGEKTAKGVIDLGKLEVTKKTKTNGNSTLEVKERVNGELGRPLLSPQKILEDLYSPLSFDPLAFSKQSSKEQAETLRKLVGINFDQLDQERKAKYDSRTITGREKTRLSAQLDSLQFIENLPTDEVLISDLMEELNKAQENNDENHRLKHEHGIGEAAISGIQDELVFKRQELKSLKTSLDNLEMGISTLNERLTDKQQNQRKKQNTIDHLVDENIQPIQDRISSSQSTNQQIRDNRTFLETQKKYREVNIEYDSFTNDIEFIDREKINKIENAKFPIDGLSFDSDGLVIFNELPFEQASHSQKLKVSISIGLELNPKLKVLLIREGSLLDDQSLITVAQIANENNAEVWLEQVGDKPGAIIIEDGEVKQ